MRNPSKTTKILVLASFSILLTAYVLYAAGILTWPMSSTDASARLKGHVLSEPLDSPPFKLPKWVALNDFPPDSSPVIAFKTLAGNNDTVALLLGASSRRMNAIEPGHLSSSKAAVIPEPDPFTGVDSVVVPRTWVNASAITYTPQYVKDESFWLMSSKSGAPRKTTHPDRVRQSQLLSEISNVKWQRLDNGDASEQQQQNVLNRK